MYFDNLTVRDTRGRIIEEDHYYAYGLKIASISSNKLPDPNEGNIDNKNLYNDKELLDDADLDWYDYGFRSYDAQIGRFMQLDPLTDDYPELTPYQYGSCEPIGNVDMDGLEGVNSLGQAVAGTQWLNNIAVTTVRQSVATVATQTARWGTKIVSGLNVAAHAVQLGAQTFANNVSKDFWSGEDQQGAITTATSQLRKEHPMQAAVHQLAYNVEDFMGFNGLDNAIADAGTGKSTVDKAINLTQAAFNAGASLGGEGEGMEGLNTASSGSRVFEVGSYKELRGVEVGLDAHHVGQKALMKKGVNGLLRRTSGYTGARQILDRDIFELRRVYPNVPNSSLEQIIQMNRRMYPSAFIKK